MSTIRNVDSGGQQQAGGTFEYLSLEVRVGNSPAAQPYLPRWDWDNIP